MKKKLLIVLNIFAFITVFGQSGIGTHTPEGALDITSPNKDWGLVLPSVDQAENTNNPTGKAVKKGTIVYDLKENCIRYFNGTEWSGCLVAPIPNSFELNCSAAVLNKDIIANYPIVAGTTVSVPYSNTGEEFAYNGITIGSSNVAGLTAVVSSGSIKKGAGILVFSISGTPPAEGKAIFHLKLAGVDCEFVATVEPIKIKLECGSAILNKDIVANSPIATGTTVSIPYSNTGENLVHGGLTIGSSNVTGLQAVLSSGYFNNGFGNLVFSISGTPSFSGEARFSLSIAGVDCEFVVTVEPIKIKLECSAAVLNQNIIANYPITAGTTVSIPYSNTGEILAHGGLTIGSSNVTGLQAVLSSGSFKKGFGNLVFSISGTPSDEGQARFSLNIAGVDCEFVVIAKNYTDVEVPIENLVCGLKDQLNYKTLGGKHIINGKEVTVDYRVLKNIRTHPYQETCGVAVLSDNIYLGGPPTGSKPSTLTITFSHPVTNVGVAFAAGNTGEEFVFTINDNQPIQLNSTGSCEERISIIDNKVNIITSVAGANITVGGKWFTELTIEHNGTGAGSTFGFCLNNSDTL